MGQGLGAVGYLLGAGGHLAGGLGDIGDGVAHADHELVDALLDGGQVAGEGGGQLHIEVALSHLAGGFGDILNDAVEYALTGTQGIAHFAQLVPAVKADGNAQVALAEAHQRGADLIAGLGNAPDDLDGHQHNNNSGNHHHSHNSDDADGGGRILLLDNIFLASLELSGQTVAGRGRGSQLGRAAIHDHAPGSLAVRAGYLDDLLGFLAPLLHGVDKGVELALVIHGEAVVELGDGRLQGGHFGSSGVQVAHFAGKHRVPQAAGGDIVVDAALGGALVGLHIVVDDVLISRLLGAHHHQRGDDNDQRNQDRRAEAHDQAFLDGHVLEIHDAFSS